MEIEELIQLIRICNLHQVQKQLEQELANKEVNEMNGSHLRQDYDIIIQFYEAASKRKK